MQETEQPKLIGRYRVIKLLGRGIQGAVYLAADPQLQRMVALKTVNLGRPAPQGTAALLHEARTVSQLQHPNVVTLYDVVEQQGQYYLVFEYVEGETLAGRLRGGKLPQAEALRIAREVLAGLVSAHAKDIVHGDLKPANIMLDQQQTARIMDFGLAHRLDEPASAAGAVAYRAPETIGGVMPGKTADVFAIGVVLYEMLTGCAPVSGRNIYRLMDAIVREDFAPPSAVVAELDDALDGIVMRALLKDPLGRYQSAAELREALELYVQPPADNAPRGAGQQGTLDFLLRRIRLKNDFPALSQAIVAINKIANADTERLQSLTDIILRDFSLTNKLLRLANSASFGQYGGSISTVSSAVIILGFETVRSLAITLILFEHLHDKAQAAQLKDEVIRTILAGLMARQVEKKLGKRNPEESFISAMFHNLGRLLATFYLFDEATEITRRVKQKELSQEMAERAVLGLSYSELGMGIARNWNFPDKLVDSMREPSLERLRVPQGAVEHMRVVASLANAITHAATTTPAAEKSARLAVLSKRYFAALPLSERDLTRLLDDVVHEFTEEAGILGLNSERSEALRNARNWVGLPSGAVAEPADALELGMQAANSLAAANIPPEMDSQAVLTGGVQDIIGLMMGEFNLNELLRTILETMYRGIGFERVLLCMRDLKTQALTARIGFGSEVAQSIKRFVVPDGKSQDVFQVALDKQADVFLSDINAGNIRDRIPAWYRETVNAESFILLPVVIDKKVVGLFYGDKAKAGELKVSPRELGLLKTLRNQAVLAIRQKQAG